MASKYSAVEVLRSMRKTGQRPEGPVVICDTPMSANWAVRNGFFAVDRRDVGEDLTPFAGLDAWVMTVRAFADSMQLASELAESCRFVTMVDGLQRDRSVFV